MPVAAIPIAIGAGKLIAGAVKAHKEKKKLKELEKNRPVYKIGQEYASNQAIAGTQAAYAQNQLQGQDQVLAAANNQVDVNASNTVNQVQQSSNSTAGILASLSGINANSNSAKRDNALDASGRLQDKQRLSMQANSALMGANNDMAEEKDKAFDYNVNQPYQNKVAAARKGRKRGAEMANSGLDMAAQGAAAMASRNK